jgi:hypothetical protein
MMAAAALAVTNNRELFDLWRRGEQQIGFRRARRWLRDSTEGMKIDGDLAPFSVFGDDDSSWTKSRYARLCAYAHSQGGYNNADFWESNGPIFVPGRSRLWSRSSGRPWRSATFCFAWAGQHTGPDLVRRPSSQVRGLAGRSTNASCAPG